MAKKKKKSEKSKKAVNNNQLGRSPNLTPDLQNKLVSVIAAGNYDDVACAHCGISDTVFYEWIQRGEGRHPTRNKTPLYAEFAEAIKKARADSEVVAVLSVRNAFSKNWQAAMTFLERRRPDRWGRRDYMSVQHEHRGTVEVTDARERLADLISRHSAAAKATATPKTTH